MGCHTCDELFGEYQAAVRLSAQATRAMSGLVGADYMMARDQLERLRVKCENANTALMTHYSEHQLKSRAASL